MSSCEPVPDKAESLPKLSAAEFRQYNKLADMMEYYVSRRILVSS
jgi:hypothetical protein